MRRSPLAAARDAALVAEGRPPVGEVTPAEVAAIDPTAIDPTEAAPAATEIPATSLPATEPVATVAATPVADAPAADAARSTRVTARRVARTLAIVALSVGLFVGGIALGATLYQNLRPEQVGHAVAGTGDGPPAVAQEFISALAANDADALRSSLDQEPHLDLTREMTKFGIQRVDDVQTLGTHSEGSRSATEILMQYESTDGTPFAINLVILVDGGKIEGFR